MEIAMLRDWVIVILGFLAIGAVTISVVLLIIIYRKVTPILDAAREVVFDVRRTSSVVSRSVIGSVARIEGLVAGVRKAAEVIASLSKKGGRKDGKR
ncbi:MAG: hypothetical protein AAGB97_08460 [Dehalococcoidia bacterium]|nr:hypothetical protein [Chloroflexota bacterium]MBT9162099.1 hypothetical protein [Chloroflexota bacterium]